MSNAHSQIGHEVFSLLPKANDSVVVGRQLQVADTGLLIISSLRAVFTGGTKTVELSYSKLVNLTVDGVQFHQSNRQTVPLFKVRNGELVVALVSAAAQSMS